MASYNKITLIGNTGGEPKLINTSTGKRKASFSIAVNEYRMKNNEKITETEWFDIECWEGSADMVEKYLSKGQELFIEGKVKTRTWTDKQGHERRKTFIVANTIQFCGGINKMKNNATSDQANDLPY